MVLKSAVRWTLLSYAAAALSFVAGMTPLGWPISVPYPIPLILLFSGIAVWAASVVKTLVACRRRGLFTLLGAPVALFPTWMIWAIGEACSRGSCL